MSHTVSDFLVQRLYDWGVRRIYGYPGDGINGIMGALRRAEEQMEFVQARPKRWPPSWPAGTRSGPGTSASASRRRDQARSTS